MRVYTTVYMYIYISIILQQGRISPRGVCFWFTRDFHKNMPSKQTFYLYNIMDPDVRHLIYCLSSSLCYKFIFFILLSPFLSIVLCIPYTRRSEQKSYSVHVCASHNSSWFYRPSTYTRLPFFHGHTYFFLCIYNMCFYFFILGGGGVLKPQASMYHPNRFSFFQHYIYYY